MLEILILTGYDASSWLWCGRGYCNSQTKVQCVFSTILLLLSSDELNNILSNICEKRVHVF